AAEYVADFIGSTNLLRGVLVSGAKAGHECEVDLSGGRCRGRLGGEAAVSDEVVLAVRPESISLLAGAAADAGPHDNALAGLVRGRIFLGENTEFLVEAAGSEVRVRASGAPAFDVDDLVVMRFAVSDCLVFRREE